jgi:hypothetical protein
MLRLALAIALGFSIAGLAGSVTAEDKKEETKPTKLEGKLVCTKCKLNETDSCGNALIVKDGDKEITYYIKDKGKAEKYHKCSGEQAATVTGKVGKDGDKKIITDAKVEKAK